MSVQDVRLGAPGRWVLAPPIKVVALSSKFLQPARYGQALLGHPPPGVCQTEAQALRPVERKPALSESESDLFKAPVTVALRLTHADTHSFPFCWLYKWVIYLDTRIQDGRGHFPSSLAYYSCRRKLWGFNRLTWRFRALQVSSILARSHTFTLQQEERWLVTGSC